MVGEEGLATLHSQTPHPPCRAPSPWLIRINTDYKTIGFCNSGQKPCVQNDSNSDLVILRTQPSPLFTVASESILIGEFQKKERHRQQTVSIVENVSL